MSRVKAKEIVNLTIKFSHIIRTSIKGKVTHEEENLILKIKSNLEDIIRDCNEVLEQSHNKATKNLLKKAEKEISLWDKKFKKGIEERNPEFFSSEEKEDILTEEGFDEEIERNGGYDDEGFDDEQEDEEILDEEY